MMKKIVISAAMLFLAQTSFAMVFTLPSNGDSVVGKVQWTQSLPGDDFSKLGRRYDIGYYELVEANPGVDPNLPHPGTIVVIPSRFVLPSVPHQGVVVSLAELRVYYFPPHSNVVYTYPVGIGREGWSTPVGTTTIIAKVKDPTWVVPKDISDWKASQGVQLPASVPPGPLNPLGAYAMYLGFPGYRMHGTNDPTGVGRRSSSGCIRIWPEDVEELFSQVSKGTQVRVIDDPYKLGWLNGKLYLESHTPLQEQADNYSSNNYTPLNQDISQATNGHPATVDMTVAQRVADQQNGVPQVVGTVVNNSSNNPAS